MRLGYVLSLFLTVACTSDADGDGSNATEDCDDENALRSPDFEEICDGIDNDCNEEVDDNATDAETYYLDVDEDGYGYAPVSIQACEAPSGYADNSDDCDDLDVNTYPSADEICDDADNDCDERIDEDVTTLYYADHDGDGYGSEIYSVEGCEDPEPPAGYVAESGDCDDKNSAVNPLAEEVCDGIDNDCQGDTDGDDDQATDALTWYVDTDGDGYGVDGDQNQDTCEEPRGFAGVAGDCNDSDVMINPDALELCDDADVDENCNDLINDQDLDISNQNDLVLNKETGEYELSWNEETKSTIWFYDADLDSYGNGADGAAEGEVRCEPQDEYRVANNLDCNDLDMAINPDAAEVCDDENMVDEDCNSFINDDDVDINYTDADIWFIDYDGDLYGSTKYTLQRCEEPDGFVKSDGSTTSADCDDTDSTINPGVEEICNDDVDNDCDGSASPCSLEGVFEVSDADFTISGSTGLVSSDNGDKVGSSMAIGDLNGDGNLDLLVGAIGLNGANTDDGGVFVFYGPLDDSSLLADTNSDAILFGGADADNAGYAVTVLDLDGDNYDDIVVTSFGEDLISADTASTALDDVGVVYVIYGGASLLSSDLELSATSDATFIGSSAGEHFGCALANVGDTNSDDRDDLLMGNCSDTGTGAAYLLYGSDTRYDGEYEFSAEILLDTDGFAEWTGETGGSYTGSSVAGIMDFDGDGNTDFAFGASQHDVVDGASSYTDAGAAFVVLGDGTEHVGSKEITEATAYFYGENAYDKAGTMVSGLGDINNDGYADLMIGAPEFDRPTSSSAVSDSGIAYIVYGALSFEDDLEAPTRIYGETTYDLLGKGGTNAGDLNDDGFADIVIGAPDANRTASTGNTGAAYLFYGPISSGDLEADVDSDAQFEGNTNGTGEFGLNFSTAIDLDNDGKVEGDLDGDNEVDLIIGARSDDAEGSTAEVDIGAVYIFSGGGL
jgi:hypothetical protein